MDELEVIRRALLEQLDMLHQAYRRDAKPILDRIVEIESLRPPKPIVWYGAVSGRWDSDGRLTLRPRDANGKLV